MAEKSLEERVTMLEREVEILEQLPDRVTALEVQIVELRGEMRAEFSATRAEAREGDEHVVQTLRQEIRAGDEETRRFMRILHDDLVERIEILGGKR
jgi:predicted phage gp36 major capsid-like protein